MLMNFIWVIMAYVTNSTSVCFALGINKIYPPVRKLDRVAPLITNSLIAFSNKTIKINKKGTYDLGYGHGTWGHDDL